MASGPAWTREQIETYRRGDDLRPSDIRRALVIERDELVRAMPEAPDYKALTLTHWRGDISWDRRTATEDEIRAGVRGLVAALWARALSAPPDGEAER